MSRPNQEVIMLLSDLPSRRFDHKNRVLCIGCIATTIIITIVVLSVVLAIVLDAKKEVSHVGYFSHAAVATDAFECSKLGRDILRRNGSVVDAAIASMFCACTFNLQSCGIGGGFFMMIYQNPRGSSKKVMEELNARETAPSNATFDMFKRASSSKGGLSIGVPGHVKGAYMAWQKYGRLPWKELCEPTIQWLRIGFKISNKLGIFMKMSEKNIRNDPEFSKYLLNPDGSLKKEGELIKLPKLAFTMEIIARNPESFYTGDLAKDIIKDIQDAKGIISLEDLRTYEAHMKAPYNATIPGVGLTLHSMSPPGSGPVLALMLKIADEMKLSVEDLKDLPGKGNTYHRLIEAMKFAFATKTFLGDDRFVDNSQALQNISNADFIKHIVSRITLNSTHPIEYYEPAAKSSMDDAGTSHLSVYSRDGCAAAITATINLGFGSGVMGKRTGIIFNDEMDDFTIPQHQLSYGTVNFIEPGKRPMSSMIPSIYTDKQGQVRFVIGGSGGPTITTSNFYTMVHRLWLNENIEEALDKPRLHTNLIPNRVIYEKKFPKNIVEKLKTKNHFMVEKTAAMNPTIVNGIENRCSVALTDDCLTAVSDLRKDGKPSGY